MFTAVDNRETYESFSAAVIAQLNAEITGDGLNMSTLAKQIDVDYGTLRRYLRNEREIPVLVLYAIIDQLSISEAELFTLARARFDRR
jgi:transcriptional regulator with XRE-family HTH domain